MPAAQLRLRRMKMLTCFPHLLSPRPACPRTPCLFVPFPISTRDPLPLEGGLETYSPVSSLGCFLSKPYSLQTSQSQRFGFAVLWARGTWLGNGGPSALAGEGKASSRYRYIGDTESVWGRSGKGAGASKVRLPQRGQR